jgi:hypothetical protein
MIVLSYNFSSKFRLEPVRRHGVKLIHLRQRLYISSKEFLVPYEHRKSSQPEYNPGDIKNCNIPDNCFGVPV